MAMMQDKTLSVEGFGPVDLDDRAGDLARLWSEILKARTGHVLAEEEVERAELLIRWIGSGMREAEAGGEPGVVRTGGGEQDQRLDEFAEMIVHELKNPLSQVQIGAEMLAQRVPEGASEEQFYLGWIQRGLARVMEVLEDVRVLALTNVTQPEARWLPIGPVVEGVLTSARDAAARRGVRCEIEGTLPDAVIDGAQVTLALGNLVSNAIKYADPQKPERWVRVKVQRITGAVEGWRFSVADNGLGIPERLQRDVFRRHFRAHPDSAEGMGLGLSITRQVIESREGQIWFYSEEGKGSVFHFVVPDRS